MTIGEILEQRAKTHGDFSEQATLDSHVLYTMNNNGNWENLK